MKTKVSSYLAVVAGGSGGHIIPALEFALRSNDKNSSAIVLFTTTKKVDDVVLKNYSTLHHIVRNKLAGFRVRNPLTLIALFGSFLGIFCKSLFFFLTKRPAAVISTGGLIALPVCFAAWLLRIPIRLYELNAVPGKAASVLAYFATEIFVTFAAARSFFGKKCSYTSYPVRFSVDDKKNKKDIFAHIAPHFSQDRKTIFILGGSQGSLSLSAQFKAFIQTNVALHTSLQIIHQTGSADSFDWSAFYGHYAIPAVVFSYTHQLHLFYQAADLVITRAGAGTLFELSFFEKKSLLIPLVTAATAHQQDNAQAMVAAYPHLFTMVNPEKLLTNPQAFYQAIMAHI